MKRTYNCFIKTWHHEFVIQISYFESFILHSCIFILPYSSLSKVWSLSILWKFEVSQSLKLMWHETRIYLSFRLLVVRHLRSLLSLLLPLMWHGTRIYLSYCLCATLDEFTVATLLSWLHLEPSWSPAFCI